MNIDLQIKYMEILNRQVEEGLDILSKMNVKDKNYQNVVVNINNANNISFQLKNQIEAEKAAEIERAKAEVNTEKATKRKYTKKVK